MNRTILAALGILAATFASVSVGQVVKRDKEVFSISPGGGTRSGNPQGGWSRVHLNGIQRALLGYVIQQQTIYLAKAGIDDRKRNRVIIKEKYFMRSMLSPAQQREFDDNVLEARRFHPGREWNVVYAAAPQLRTLLSAMPSQEKKIKALEAKMESIYLEMRRKAPKQPSDAAAWSRKGAKAQVDFLMGVRKVLTPAQVKEWDRFTHQLVRELASVIAT